MSTEKWCKTESDAFFFFESNVLMTWVAKRAFGLGWGVRADVLYGRPARCAIMMLQPVVRRWCSCGSCCPPVVYAVLRSWWRPIRRKQIPVYFTTWSCDWVVLPSCYVDEGRFVERDSWTVILCQAVVFQYISQPGVVNEFRLDRE